MNLTQVKEAAELLRWQAVPSLMLELYEKSAGVAEQVRAIKDELGFHPDTRGVYWNPDSKQLWMSTADSEENDHVEKWRKKLSAIKGVDDVRIEAEYGPPGKESEPWVKVAGSAALEGIGEALNYFPNKINRHIPGLQSPLGAALTSGLLGAGLGYAGGALAEQALPESWHRGKLRRTAAILGGLGLSVPALAWGAANVHSGKSLLDGWPLDDGPHPPATPSGKQPDTHREQSFVRKMAEEYHSETGVSREPLINVDAFNRTIWGDPNIVLQPAIRAAAGGLVTGAATLAGGGRQAKLITPMDLGRMSAGMGSGYLAGALLGKALGVMAGMPQPAQDRLKQTGMYAGVIANLVPLAFGGGGN